MIEFGLALSRFLHYAASTALAGVAFFPLYAYAATEPERLVRWRGRVLLCSAILALISCLGWFAFSVALMGGGLTDVVDPEVVRAVVHHTGFGVVWMIRMAVAAGLVAVTIMLPSRSSMQRDQLIAFLAAGLLASLAGAGEGGQQSGGKERDELIALHRAPRRQHDRDGDKARRDGHADHPHHTEAGVMHNGSDDLGIDDVCKSAAHQSHRKGEPAETADQSEDCRAEQDASAPANQPFGLGGCIGIKGKERHAGKRRRCRIVQEAGEREAEFDHQCATPKE